MPCLGLTSLHNVLSTEECVIRYAVSMPCLGLTSLHQKGDFMDMDKK